MAGEYDLPAVVGRNMQYLDFNPNPPVNDESIYFSPLQAARVYERDFPVPTITAPETPAQTNVAADSGKVLSVLRKNLTASVEGKTPGIFINAGPMQVVGPLVVVDFGSAEEAERFAKLFVRDIPNTPQGWVEAGKLTLRGHSNGSGRYSVRFESFLDGTIPDQRALFVVEDGPSKGTVILRREDGTSLAGASYDVIPA